MPHATLRPLMAVAVILLTAVPATAQAPLPDATRTVPVRFARGADSATVQGRVRGYDTVDYVLDAREGQRLTVSMRSSNRFAYFTVLPPGDPTAPEGGSTVTDYSGVLTAGGDWRVRVFLMRNAARRGERAAYTLTTSIR
ncbi:MAG: hypothetical protein EON91_09675 [Brevundimonas sp.]|uniref:hypothetical protein n=1 Tax=Brevundimonas sp. TaxID=1871086 RepID=UPI0012223179|nr:hypothetical protein [Brevundimonas sp.]RZJ17316.1 MAG: hypothetical protein EON91_09675 [Brevundimonas sp.]